MNTDALGWYDLLAANPLGTVSVTNVYSLGMRQCAVVSSGAFPRSAGRAFALTENACFVPGIRVGHYTDTEAVTGCTAVLCGQGAVAGVDVRGSAPGTRETDALRPGNAVTEAQAVLLAGGSAFGLDAASGVVRYLEERGYGFRVGEYTVPIVPAAVLFDLSVGDGRARPDSRSGYAACLDASAGPVAEGSVGAGTGATVGKLLGPDMAVKGGLGVSRVEMGNGVVVGAVVAVNAVGSVVDPETAEVVAGPRTCDGMVDAAEALVGGASAADGLPGRNTTIGVVATNARLNKEQATKLAAVSHDGIAISVRPAHTMSDGDTMFALATGCADAEMDMHALCAAATICTARAIARGVRTATGLGGIPAATEL